MNMEEIEYNARQNSLQISFDACKKKSISIEV